LNEANATDGEIMMIYMRQLISHAEKNVLKLQKKNSHLWQIKLNILKVLKTGLKILINILKKS
jgi:hypothetical protein